MIGSHITWVTQRCLYIHTTNLLGLESSITTEEREGLAVTESKLGSDDVLVGIQNTCNQARSFTYSLGLKCFGLAEGKYWVHCIDEDLTLGDFESECAYISFALSLNGKAVKMLVISISKVKPLYSVDTSPPIPTQSLKYQIGHDKPYAGFTKEQVPFRSACFQALWPTRH